MTLLTAWPLIKRFGPWALLGLLAFLLLLDAQKLKARDASIVACAAQKAQLAADVRARTAEAQAADIAHKQAVEAAQDTVTKETADALETQLAAARADAARYSARLRDNASADRGSGGTTSVPEPTDPAGSVAGAGEAAIVDDASACAENTVKAQGWLDWWKGEAGVQR